MKVLITGAAGFVGSELVTAALGRDWTVRALVRPVHEVERWDTTRVEVFRADLGTGSALETVASAVAGVDAVVHAAARLEWGSSDEFHRDTVQSTVEVAEAAAKAGVGRVVLLSSTAVYGDRAPRFGPVDEDSPAGGHLGRWDRYGRAKLEAEVVLARVAAGGPMSWTVLRPGWILGARSSSVRALMRTVQGPVCPLFGRGANRLPVTSVESVVDACLRAIETPQASGRAYNLAGDWPVTQRELLSAFARLGGASPLWVPTPLRVLEAGGLVSEAAARLLPGFAPPLSRNTAWLLGLDADFPTDRIRQELGWVPARTFASVMEGLSEAASV